jgi:hypothetical protein
LVATCRAFHAALAGIERPGWVGRGHNRWAIADRMAWGEGEAEVAPELADLVGALMNARRPLRSPSQLVHGDIAGNVLFAADQPPTIIDFSPFWRPAGYALAIAAVDLLTWSGAPPSILGELAEEDGIDQLLLRALIFRLVTESLGRTDPGTRQAVRRAGEPVVDLFLSRVSGRSPTAMFATDQDIAGLTGRVLGQKVRRLRTPEGGHTRAMCRTVECDDGTTVFVKAASPAARTDVAVEQAVYQALSDEPFLPRLLASTHEPIPALVLEALPHDGWVGEWTPHLVEATHRLLDHVHGLRAPEGVPRLGVIPNPWDALAADPQRLLRLDVCSADWLTTHLDTFHAAADDAQTTGDSLIHRDVHAANLWQHDNRLILLDWASAAIGDPWLDHHLWLVALNAEGGPAPEARQGPHATGHAALIAGIQPLLTPAHDTNPPLFDQRRRRLATALSWAARLLHIPPPTTT